MSWAAVISMPLAGCLVLLLPVAGSARDNQPRHAEALHQLEALNAQITVRNDQDGDGNLIIATDGAWQGGDEGLKLLQDVQGLYKLRLGGKITDVGLSHLADMTALKSLDVHVTMVTDEGVAHLRKLTRLERLNLTYTKVSDVGLRSLVGLKKLQWLGLAYTRVTTEGVKKLQKELPETTIEGNFRH